MRKVSGRLLFLVASIALAIGSQATWCDVINLFGVDAHHHAETGRSLCVTSHDHFQHEGHCDHSEEEPTPCSEDSAFDLMEAQLPKTEKSSGLMIVLVLPRWLEVQPIVPKGMLSTSFTLLPRKVDRPPQHSSPPFSGCFLI